MPCDSGFGVDEKSPIWVKTLNPLPSKHPRPLEITPPIGSHKSAVKKGHRQSHEPLIDSGEIHQHKARMEEKEGRWNQREQKGGGGGSSGFDQKKKKNGREDESGLHGEI